MAELKQKVSGDFDELLKYLEAELNMASLEASGEGFAEGGARLAVRVFEQYSWLGGNRMSLTVTLFQNGGDIQVYAVGAGASQAMFFKVNTWSEQGMIDKLAALLYEFAERQK